MAAEVLLIDDNDKFSESLIRSLQRHDIEVDRASSWDEGIQLFKIGLHELVIADYRLPNSDHGLELLAKIKPLRPTAELGLISGEIPSAPADRIQATGLVNFYLAKDGSLFEKILARATEAVARAKVPSDWKAVSEAFLGQHEIDSAEINAISDMLKRSIGEA